MKFSRFAVSALVLFAAVSTASCGVAQNQPVSTQSSLKRGDKAPLAVRLGFKETDKILIINNDDAGMSHATNRAVINGLEKGLTNSATIMVPCPWFPQIAAYAKSHPQADFGIHLTHTSEWKTYRWGPVVGRDKVPGLVDKDGYFYPDTGDVYAHSNPAEVEIESRAQIEKAQKAGVDITHLDSHMGVMHFLPPFHQVYRKLAKELDVPIRMGSQDMLAQLGGGDQRAELDADGILYPDYLIHGALKPNQTLHDWWIENISSIKPGVTECYMHAAESGDEMKGISDGVESSRAMEYKLFVTGNEMRDLLKKYNIKTVGWRAIRDLQRRERASQKAAPGK